MSDLPLCTIELQRDVTTEEKRHVALPKKEDMEAHDLNPLHILSKVSCVQV